jgi:hypothetical protein
MNCLEELKNYAVTDTKDNKSPVIRLMKIEGYLKKHLEKLK